MATQVILGPDEKPVVSERYDVCPKCGRGPEKRQPSGGFGQTWLVCPCGYEFERKLQCQTVIP